MKDERSVRQRRTAGRKWRPAALILAAVLVFLSLPLAGKAAESVPNNVPNGSLKVVPGSMELLNDLADADIQIDLYRIADAERANGYDTYNWIPTAAFANGAITIPNETDSAAGKTAWEKATQDAAKIVLGFPESGADWNPSSTTAAYQGGALGIYTGNTVTYTTTGNGEKSNVAASFGNLKAGLYLVLAHGNKVTNYARKNADGTGIITIAQSGVYEYTFRPEIVAIPSKSPVITPGETYNTADAGAWQFDVTAILKPTQEERLGSLRIYKELLRYAEREKTNEEGETRRILDPATFIFEVSVYESETAAKEQNSDALVYHDDVSIAFDTFGEKSVLIENLPVNSYAVVEEIYSGGIYSTDVDQETVIEANKEMSVQFQDDYDNLLGGGGSITNKFQYDEDGGWTLDQVKDDTEESMNDPDRVHYGNQ